MAIFLDFEPTDLSQRLHLQDHKKEDRVVRETVSEHATVIRGLSHGLREGEDLSHGLSKEEPLSERLCATLSALDYQDCGSVLAFLEAALGALHAHRRISLQVWEQVLNRVNLWRLATVKGIEPVVNKFIRQFMHLPVRLSAWLILAEPHARRLSEEGFAEWCVQGYERNAQGLQLIVPHLHPRGMRKLMSLIDWEEVLTLRRLALTPRQLAALLTGLIQRNPSWLEVFNPDPDLAYDCLWLMKGQRARYLLMAWSCPIVLERCIRQWSCCALGDLDLLTCLLAVGLSTCSPATFTHQTALMAAINVRMNQPDTQRHAQFIFNLLLLLAPGCESAQPVWEGSSEWIGAYCWLDRHYHHAHGGDYVEPRYVDYAEAEIAPLDDYEHVPVDAAQVHAPLIDQPLDPLQINPLVSSKLKPPAHLWQALDLLQQPEAIPTVISSLPQLLEGASQLALRDYGLDLAKGLLALPVDSTLPLLVQLFRRAPRLLAPWMAEEICPAGRLAICQRTELLSVIAQALGQKLPEETKTVQFAGRLPKLVPPTQPSEPQILSACIDILFPRLLQSQSGLIREKIILILAMILIQSVHRLEYPRLLQRFLPWSTQVSLDNEREMRAMCLAWHSLLVAWPPSLSPFSLQSAFLGIAERLQPHLQHEWAAQVALALNELCSVNRLVQDLDHDFKIVSLKTQ